MPIMYDQIEVEYKKEMFAIENRNPFCRLGFELDICRSCGFYDLVTDYCEVGLFEAFEKEGRRPCIQDCTSFIDVMNIQADVFYLCF